MPSRQFDHARKLCPIDLRFSFAYSAPAKPQCESPMFSLRLPNPDTHFPRLTSEFSRREFIVERIFKAHSFHPATFIENSGRKRNRQSSPVAHPASAGATADNLPGIGADGLWIG
jgi:hypothetical protein